MTILSCRSFAKVNLTLDILARRADGYHELQSIVHTVGLADTLRFEFGAGTGVSLLCNDVQLRGDDNLCLRAARAWQEAARGVELGEVRITLEKQIPAGAGLGGGSGNAAATLRALNRHFGDCLAEAELSAVAATLGADVPFFLRGGCALMEGVGEKLTPLPQLSGWLVLAQPAQGLSTPAVYRRYDEIRPASQRATPVMLKALRAGDLEAVARTLGNDLTAAAQSLGVDVAALAEALRCAGAPGAVMTGSGSCVFGLFATEASARAALAVLAELRARGDHQRFHRLFAVPLVGTGSTFSAADDFISAAKGGKPEAEYL